ncbi:extracellular serine-rich protein [Paraphaeosphaeria sporulosa]
MYFSKSIIASALLGLAAATTHSGEAISAGLATSSTSAIAASETRSAAPNAAASAAATSGASAGNIATHVIQVGGPNGSITFSPENVKAAPGDLVQFQFHPKNHSVVQSTFDKPCVPIQNVMPNMTTAFFSGFMPTNASVGATSQVLTYTIRVMDTKPIWFYCSQAKHCQGGMVGAINAAETGNKTMSAFKALAASATENLSPGQAPGSGTQSGRSWRRHRSYQHRFERTGPANYQRCLQHIRLAISFWPGLGSCRGYPAVVRRALDWGGEKRSGRRCLSVIPLLLLLN